MAWIIDNTAANYIPNREVNHQVGTQKRFEDASEALRICTARGPKHANCIPKKKSILPTRVIDCLDLENPKIHVANQSEEDFYAALSYVWGEHQPNKTTTANLPLYTEKIEPSLIPQTIRDALHCTRKLGLRYLWVDSFCILQDSNDDKKREIARMREIFRGAFVTIVAASADKVSQGFLQDRSPPRKATRLPFICPDRDDCTASFLIREPTGHHMQDDAVNSRAWCLEERLLTPRALIYSSKELQYSCISTDPHPLGNSSGAFLGAYVRLPPFLHYPVQNSYQNLARGYLVPEFSLNDIRESELQTSWNQVVQEYTRRDLTRQKDRLVALGGVVEEFQRFWESSHYLAGLWSHRLLDDLLWSKSSLEKPQDRPEIYRGPSWSWASINGQVSSAQPMDIFWPMRFFYLCEVSRCEVSLADDRYPFGEVTGGFLELRAVMTEVFWSPTSSRLYSPDEGDCGDLLTKHASPDCSEEKTRMDGRVWAVPIRRCLGGGFNSLEGLLLVPAMEPEGAYRRVGSFTVGLAKPLQGFNAQAWLSDERKDICIV